MRLIFYGTKGYIEEESAKHRKYTCLKVDDILFDLGEGWGKRLKEIKPKAIFITHAHLDHAGGLTSLMELPVYASAGSFKIIKREVGLPNLREIKPNQKIRIKGLEITVYPVEHSILAPTSGYKIKGDKTVVFNPDLVYIPNREKILKNVDLYIGDGSTLTRPLIRRKGSRLFGHVPVRTQVGWCRKFKIKKAVFAHFGKQAVEMDERLLKRKLQEFGNQKVEVTAAYDGMEMKI